MIVSISPALFTVSWGHGREVKNGSEMMQLMLVCQTKMTTWWMQYIHIAY